jgi:hypothetical protein
MKVRLPETSCADGASRVEVDILCVGRMVSACFAPFGYLCLSEFSKEFRFRSTHAASESFLRR